MKVIWKRNIVVIAVLLFVCAAVYLNFRYASEIVPPDQEGEASETGQKILGQSTLVNGEESIPSEDDASSGETDVMGENGDYFAQARLNRQQARDSAISLLREAAESDSADTAAATEAAETIQVLAGYAVAESQIENLVTAKGYQDCVAFMGDDAISIVVSTEGGLQAEDVAKITEIVLTETDYTADQVKIFEAN